MKLVSYLNKEYKSVFGILDSEKIYPLSNCNTFLECIDFLKNKTLDNILDDEFVMLSETSLLSPIPKPTSLRDAYAFRQHVEAGRKSRNLPMIKEYDDFPVYYYSNHNAVCGPGEIKINKKHMEKLDFELEIAAIIGKKGENISVEEADDYIFGYTIMNDLSARKVQKDEMKLNLGPAKGKDFATVLGPYIITKDELEPHKINSDEGSRYNLEMSAYINQKLVSSDNFSNITWTFAQILSRISYGATLYPGDVIGSGTCSTGCFLELNQTNKTDIWLQNGDRIDLKIQEMGVLSNKINQV